MCLKTLKSPRDGVKYAMIPISFDVKERAAYKANAIFAVRVQYFPCATVKYFKNDQKLNTKEIVKNRTPSTSNPKDEICTFQKW